MASAFRDTRNNRWIADFRPMRGGGVRRKVQIPRDRCLTAEDARAFAEECFQYCRLLERVTQPDRHDVLHALHIKAINASEASALLPEMEYPIDLPQDLFRRLVPIALKGNRSVRDVVVQIVNGSLDAEKKS